MNKDNCFQLGHIAKVHGLQGELLLVLDVDFPEDYEDLPHVFVEKSGRLVPFILEHMVPQPNNKFLAKFEEFDHVDQVKPLVGAGLFLPLSSLPKLKDDQYYFHDLVGFTVVDENLGQLGEVRVIYDLETQDLLGMEYQNKEVLIPIQEGILQKVDKAEKKVFCRLPEGLLDIYLED
ncbi:16S rRNA processing protein RimM [Cyclobacterium lianum]|uniref:Ribosome maturation factor RimM n=1 Tax=Cyclobacterium lianum TaxID=388280 RepID=A0A1M7IBE3_9BACT|nr:ribosome maturation factor RimM [Cyclobacterium lianum]SHM38082.1 16S rRNA processing protein RimM [Cyclobacterium lianum]